MHEPCAISKQKSTIILLISDLPAGPKCKFMVFATKSAPRREGKRLRDVFLRAVWGACDHQDFGKSGVPLPFFIGWFLRIRDSQHVDLIKLARIGYLTNQPINVSWLCIALCPNTFPFWLVHPAASENCPRNAWSVASKGKMQTRFVKKWRRKPKKHRSPRQIWVSWIGLRWIEEIIPKCFDLWLSLDRTHVG